MARTLPTAFSSARVGGGIATGTKRHFVPDATNTLGYQNNPFLSFQEVGTESDVVLHIKYRAATMVPPRAGVDPCHFRAIFTNLAHSPQQKISGVSGIAYSVPSLTQTNRERLTNLNPDVWPSGLFILHMDGFYPELTPSIVTNAYDLFAPAQGVPVGIPFLADFADFESNARGAHSFSNSSMPITFTKPITLSNDLEVRLMFADGRQVLHAWMPDDFDIYVFFTRAV